MRIRTILQITTSVSLFFVMNGCTAIGNWADSVGEHMPVFGERCEHWQCFTSEGQAISDANKKKMQSQQQAQQAAQPSAHAPDAIPAPPYPDAQSDTSVVRH